MFGFMKKLTDKDKEEKERKRKDRLEKEQKKLNNGLTADELFRLEEARQSLQQKKSYVSIAPGDFTFRAQSSGSTNTKSARGPPPIIHPKPVKRGFSKEKVNAMNDVQKDSKYKSDMNFQNEAGLAKEISSVQSVEINTNYQPPKESPQKRIFSASLKKTKDVQEKKLSIHGTRPVVPKKSQSLIRTDSPSNKLYEMLQNKIAPLILVNHLESRKIILKRLQSGDFGFSLRKGVTVIRKTRPGDSDVWRQVIFAESGSKNINLGFLPGDSIVEVGKTNVESSNRETIVEILKKSGSQVEIVVQTVPELNEVVSRMLQQSDATKHRDMKAKSEDQLSSDQLSLSSKDVWLIHQGGCSPGKLLEQTTADDVKVELEPGVIVQVTEDDVEKVNPSYLDRVEDVTLLRFVNESSVLHTLRQRYAGNLIHTSAGFSMLAINSVHPLSIYSDKVVQLFKESRSCDLPPHIYSVAQSTFKAMMSTRQDQSIVLLGRSGSGKTFHAQGILNYFVTAHGSSQSVLTCDKLSAISTLIEAFATCKTRSGYNSTKFTQIFSLDFDQNGQVASASIQAMMLEKARVIGSQRDGETAFNVFNHFINGVEDSLRKDLLLDRLDSKHPFLHSSEESLTKAPHNWSRILSCFKVLKISDDEVMAFCFVLAAICHLQFAGTIKGPNNKNQFKNSSAAESAARLLGTNVDDLTKIIFQGGNSSLSSLSPALKIASSRETAISNFTGGELLEIFNASLYAELFNAVICVINRSLASNCRTMATVMVVDAPGFRTTPSEGGANLSDLFHNYVQEKLQNLFHENVFNSTQELYLQEGIDVDFDFPEPYSSVLVQLIDNPPQNLTRSVECNGNLNSNRGLLWILDEQSLVPSTSDEEFVEDLQSECSHFQLKSPMILPGSSETRFVLNHMNGSCPVEYDVSGWLKAAREGTLGRSMGPFLMDSKKAEISELFGQTCKTLGGTTMSGSLAGMADAPSSLKRVSSMKRSFTSGVAAVRKKSLSLQIKFQSDALMDVLRRAKTSFVHCLSPHDSPDHLDVLNVPLLRDQLRSFLILPSIRLYKQGFPENLSFSEFIHKFRILSRLSHSESQDRNNVEQVLGSLEIDPSSYRLGSTKVFFHSGVLNQLECLKEEIISNWLIRLQSVCRLNLARKKLQKLELQHKAIACVQKNVKKFMSVREWSWWRLYLRIKPLLNVHKTEEELRDMQFEVDQLKQRLDKSEKEKQEYKQAFEKLEARMTELALELQDEQNTASQASEMLENETSKRLQLEKDLKELQAKHNGLQGQTRNLEAEVMNLRMVANSIESEAEEEEIEDSVYKERFERSKKDNECMKKQMELKFEEEKEELESSKRTLEKKIAEMNLEEERLENQLNELRRKQQKQSQEMADLKIHLEEQVARNAELEKKQRRFDLDLSKVNDLLKDERSAREKLQKERDDLIGQKFTTEKDYKNLEMDFEAQSQKLHKLELEMVELASIGKDDKEALKTRQLKNDLEGKIKDLEEELDEQAGTIQQLEQAKLRLEMAQERLRQQHSKEVEEKENDLEELKRSFHKKFKTLEIQLEEEYEERQKCLRDKREMERKLQAAAGEKPARDKDVEALLKRDLRRTKALLQDAQLMLQKYKESAGSRQTVKQLKDQLEDAEFATAAALKAKKAMELEVNDLQQQLDDMTKFKNEAEERFVSVNKEKHELQSRLEESDEEMSELMKKYKTAVQQHSLDLIKFDEQSHQIELLQQERESLKEEMARLQSRTDYFETSTVDRETIARLEAKIRDLEAKLDLEQTTRRRTEVQLTRLREQVEAEADSKQTLKSEELRFQDQLRHSHRKVKELEDEINELQLKESEAVKRKHEMERKLEQMEAEHEQTQSDLHLAFKRIADLQAVIEDDIETNNSDDSDEDLPSADEDEAQVSIK